jgi:hypothetical protein
VGVGAAEAAALAAPPLVVRALALAIFTFVARSALRVTDE